MKTGGVSLFSEFVKKAYEKAKEQRLKAYAPYSKYLVGATLKISGSDEYYSGCNVENASYGGTVCAERIAVFNAVSKLGKPSFEFLVLVTDSEPAAAPCGLCLQVLVEFCPGDMPVYLSNLDGIRKVVKLRDLLPQPFDSSALS